MARDPAADARRRHRRDRHAHLDGAAVLRLQDGARNAAGRRARGGRRQRSLPNPRQGRGRCVVGNEDGAHHVVAERLQALNDTGFSIAANACTTCWVARRCSTDYIDLEDPSRPSPDHARWRRTPSTWRGCCSPRRTRPAPDLGMRPGYVRTKMDPSRNRRSPSWAPSAPGAGDLPVITWIVGDEINQLEERQPSPEPSRPHADQPLTRRVDVRVCDASPDLDVDRARRSWTPSRPPPRPGRACVPTAGHRRQSR